MSTRIAINGLGRIGRSVVRALAQRDTRLELVAVNDVADAAALAALLRYDSVDLVLDCSGRFRTRDQAAAHLGAGAGR